MSVDNKNLLERLFLIGVMPYVWIAAAVSALYAKSLSFGYTFLDDNLLVLNNCDFLKDIASIVSAFFYKVYIISPSMPYYRPVLIVSFVLDSQLGGVSLFVYHLTNVLIHITVSSLVFILFLQLGYRRALSLFFALIFAVHPVLTQAVAWVPGRNDSIMAAFSIASFIFFLRFLGSRSRKDYLWHLLFLLLAIFTKETALIMIVICYLYYAIVRGKQELMAVWKILLTGHIIICALFFIPRHFVTMGSDPITLYDICNLIIQQIPSIVQLIGKALFPVHQSVFPTMRDSSSWYGLAAVALIAALVIFFKKGSRRLILFGAVWLILFLIPPLIRSHGIAIGDVLEHRIYLPIIGLMIIFMELDLFTKGSVAAKRTPAVLGAVVLAVFFAKAYLHCENFRDATAFWEDAVRASPRSSYVHLRLGEIYYDSHRLNDSIEQLNEAVKLDLFSTFDAHQYLVKIYLKKNLTAQAEKELRKTIALNPDDDWAYMLLGVLCYKSGREKDAEALWKKSLEKNTYNFEAAKNLVLYYAEKRDFVSSRKYVGWLRRLGIEPPPELLKTIGEK